MNNFRVQQISGGGECEVVCDCDNPGSLKSMIETSPQNFWVGRSDCVLDALGRFIAASQWNLSGRPPPMRIVGATMLVIRRA